ncbi:MAG: 4-hydroxy-tetrahydrodipicolinate synthase [Pseudomonadota bacterium]
MIQGSLTALITPFRDGIVDEQAFIALVERQIASGTHGLVPCGTTGESPTLSHEEHRRVVELCVKTAAGRVPVVAGAGSNSTAESVELVRHAKAVGADAALVATGYYNKPSQAGLIAHFRTLSEAVDLPLIVYNVPGRTIVDISVDTLGALSKLKNVAGVKDATGELDRVGNHRRLCGEDFILLSGDDGSALGFNALGGTGCISVTSNVAPALCAQMQEASLKGDHAAARAINDKLASLHTILFCEPSPAPIKYACSLLGLCTEDVRLPLLPMTDEGKAKVRAAMKLAGLPV